MFGVSVASCEWGMEVQMVQGVETEMQAGDRRIYRKM